MTDRELDQIHRALQKDSVYIHPQLRSYFSETELSQIKKNIAASDQPVFVVAYPFRRNDEYAGKPADLLTRLHGAYPENGIYLATTTELAPDEYTSIGIEGRQYGIPGEPDGDLDSFRLPYVITKEDHPSLGSAFARATELVAAGPEAIDRAAEKVSDSSTADSRGMPPAEEGVSTGTVALVIGALVVAVVAIAGWRMLRSHRKATVLPPAAVDRIRAARDRELESRARDDVLALGEAIDAADIEQGGDAAAWQIALDSYSAARGLLRDVADPDVLDVVGAIVLAENGRLALDAARAGRPFTPPSRCFLNPLHGRAGQDRRVEYAGRSMSVPLCRECHDAVQRERSPDILDVERRGRPVHYFETDAEPWSSTGYGSLEPDLLSRLTRRR